MLKTISDASSYDNMWFGDSTEDERFPMYEVYHFDKPMFANDAAAASLAVSDHRPVGTLFGTFFDDDEEGNWGEPTAAIPDTPAAAPVAPTGWSLSTRPVQQCRP